MLFAAFIRNGALFCLAAACGSCANGPSSNPSTGPSAPVPSTARSNVSIASITANGERIASGGYTYRVVVRLRETAGVAGRVDAADVRITSGSDLLLSSRQEQLLPASANVIAANATVDTREIVVADADQSHAYATAISAVVSYSDGVSVQTSAAASTGVPPLGEAQTQYTLSGTITDQATNASLEGARVEILNGANAGKAATTDRSGAYTLTGLASDTLRMRASAPGYDAGEQNITITGNMRADMALRKTVVVTCNYSVTATNGTDGRGQLAISWQGGSSSLTLTRTSGSCDWRATTDVSWIILASTSGSGSGLLPFNVAGNGLTSRTGVITLEWTGGRGQVTVFQGTSPDTCQTTLTVSGQNTIAVPQGGGQYTALLAPLAGSPVVACGFWTATASSSAVAFIGPNTGVQGNGTVTFTVSPNTTGSSRTLYIDVSGAGSARLTINQSS
jgi:hypothetical protein